MNLFSKRDEVLVCPKCGGTEKKFTGNMPTNYVNDFHFMEKHASSISYMCLCCGFMGSFFSINKSELDDFKNELLNSD